MRIIIMSIIAIISYVMQTTLLGYIQIFGIKPNLIVITVVSYALIRGKEEGAVYGLFSGLLMDIMGGKVIGIYALMGTYLGLAIGSLNKNLYKENYLIPIALTAGSTFLYNLFYYFITYFVVGDTNLLFFLINYIIPETIYNTVVALFIYFIILYINKKLDYKKNLKKSLIKI